MSADHGRYGRPVTARRARPVNARTAYRAEVRQQREQIIDARAAARALAAMTVPHKGRRPANTEHALAECAAHLRAPDGPAERRRNGSTPAGMGSARRNRNLRRAAWVAAGSAAS